MKVVIFIPGHQPRGKWYDEYVAAVRKRVRELLSILPEAQLYVRESVADHFTDFRIARIIRGTNTNTREETKMLKNVLQEAEVQLLILIDAPSRLPRRVRETTKLGNIKDKGIIVLFVSTEPLKGWEDPVIIEDPHKDPNTPQFEQAREFFELQKKITEAFYYTDPSKRGEILTALRTLCTSL